MFKKLKDKIAEEVRQAPLRLPASVQQQLSQVNIFAFYSNQKTCWLKFLLWNHDTTSDSFKCLAIILFIILTVQSLSATENYYGGGHVFVALNQVFAFHMLFTQLVSQYSAFTREAPEVSVGPVDGGRVQVNGENVTQVPV
jgi:heme A synthase